MALRPSHKAFCLSQRALRQSHCPLSTAAAAAVAATSSSSHSTSIPSTRTATTTSRSFSSTTTRRNDPSSSENQPVEDRPRWSYTPEAMKAPFSLNTPRVPSRQAWKVNEDPQKLDQFYDRFLSGVGGARMLPDELKWLAVTHKSFDQGRRGFNTRLAFFGRQIMVLETMRSVVSSPIDPSAPAASLADPYDRQPFSHPALANIDKLAAKQPQDIISKERLAKLGLDTGLHEVTRWKPRVPENLRGSGLETVLATSIFAIVGAISLQHGAEAASRVAREKIIRRVERS